jgi:hypothetical protein
LKIPKGLLTERERSHAVAQHAKGVVAVNILRAVSRAFSLFFVRKRRGACDSFFYHSHTLPGRLHALNKEVTGSELVCYKVVAVIDNHTSSAIADTDGPHTHTHLHIRQLLQQATTKLTELRTLIDRIETTAERSKAPLLAVSAWQKEQDRLLALQEEIKTVKYTLNITLDASNP